MMLPEKKATGLNYRIQAAAAIPLSGIVFTAINPLLTGFLMCKFAHQIKINKLGFVQIQKNRTFGAFVIRCMSSSAAIIPQTRFLYKHFKKGLAFITNNDIIHFMD